MPRYQYDVISGEFGILGIVEVTTANYGDVWFGVNTPKPKRASRAIAGRDNSSITTFIASAKEETVGIGGTAEAPTSTGWALVSNGANYTGNFGL